jgi:hypothetical protein
VTAGEDATGFRLRHALSADPTERGPHRAQIDRAGDAFAVEAGLSPGDLTLLRFLPCGLLMTPFIFSWG